MRENATKRYTPTPSAMGRLYPGRGFPHRAGLLPQDMPPAAPRACSAADRAAGPGQAETKGHKGHAFFPTACGLSGLWGFVCRISPILTRAPIPAPNGVFPRFPNYPDSKHQKTIFLGKSRVPAWPLNGLLAFRGKNRAGFHDSGRDRGRKTANGARAGRIGAGAKCIGKKALWHRGNSKSIEH